MQVHSLMPGHACAAGHIPSLVHRHDCTEEEGFIRPCADRHRIDLGTKLEKIEQTKATSTPCLGRLLRLHDQLSFRNQASHLASEEGSRSKKQGHISRKDASDIPASDATLPPLMHRSSRQTELLHWATDGDAPFGATGGGGGGGEGHPFRSSASSPRARDMVFASYP
ncbi:hypothetical protein M440DRAFT_1089671 [Trichoderma longibrachiatum ATCC 18648]|uniref:Uncharacterized protein n=1 Tax=Trichoderma longibrachiatum ATCC 18648 TaxID=983965 RepID=A0A2T4BT47_TRILO|nr:hypothetical protein M440DRAFT_1089671 [Trichoderma longibrachiatum ATCC 18648]